MKPTPPLLIHQALVSAFALGMVSCSEDSSEALGTLEWDRINGRAVTSEPIVEVLVKEGQQVKQGAPLIKLDTRLQEARIAQLQAQVVKAEWSLKQLETGYRQEEIATAKAELAGAVQNLKTMQVEYERKVRLGDPGAVSEQAIERAENNLAQAKAKELTARENLHLLESGYREEEVEQARAQLEATRAELGHAKTELELYTVLAERDGLVDSLPFRLGDKPPSGSVVSVVLAGEAPWARVYLPQPWLSSVKLGDAVEVYVDGRDTPISGRIRHIESSPSFTPYYTLSEDDRSRLSYVTEIDLDAGQTEGIPLGTPVRLKLGDE